MLWLEMSPAISSSVVSVIRVDLPDSFAPWSCSRPSAYQISAASYTHTFTTPARSGSQRSVGAAGGRLPGHGQPHHPYCRAVVECPAGHVGRLPGAPGTLPSSVLGGEWVQVSRQKRGVLDQDAEQSLAASVDPGGIVFAVGG